MGSRRLLDFQFDKFGEYLDIKQRAKPLRKMDLDRVVSRWEQIGTGGRRAVWHLHHLFHSFTAIEPHDFKQQSRLFLDCAFDEFCVAAESGFEHHGLGDADEHARARSYKPE